MSTIAVAFAVITTVAFAFAFWRMKRADEATPTHPARTRAPRDGAGRGR